MAEFGKNVLIAFLAFVAVAGVFVGVTGLQFWNRQLADPALVADFASPELPENRFGSYDSSESSNGRAITGN